MSERSKQRGVIPSFYGVEIEEWAGEPFRESRREIQNASVVVTPDETWRCIACSGEWVDCGSARLGRCSRCGTRRVA